MTRRAPTDDQFSEAELRWLCEQREIDKRRRAVARVHRWAGRTLADGDFRR